MLRRPSTAGLRVDGPYSADDPALQAAWVAPSTAAGWDPPPTAHRIVSDGKFKHSIEDHPPASGSPSIETEHELVEITLQMRVIDPALMGAEVPALGKGGNPVHTGKQCARVVPPGRGGSLAVRSMDVAKLVYATVAGPLVGDDCRAWLDVRSDEGVERGG